VSTVESYLRKRAITAPWRVECGPLEAIECVVVIPALAERAGILKTLRSLAANPRAELARTMVVVVVNNREPGVARPDDIADNQQTLDLLRGLLHGPETGEGYDVIEAGLRLACIDASSPGLELPAKDGVGLARRIGLDAALRLLHEAGAGDASVLLSTDADTFVEPNYLESVRRYFARPEAWAACVGYAHRLDGTDAEIAAVVAYETHLRCHVLGLQLAGSPYAYPAVGSTIVCSARAYAAAGGMNRRQAGEDFYFLQQLAKTGRVESIHATTVHPAPRASHRVPFGTGRWIQERLDDRQELMTYHPESYRILGDLLALVNARPEADPDSILAELARISRPATEFLEKQKFAECWQKLHRNSPDSRAFLAQFHRWMDAFKTLKLLHCLRDNGFPQQPLWTAAKALLERAEKMPPAFPWQNLDTERKVQIALLRHLRKLERLE